MDNRDRVPDVDIELPLPNGNGLDAAEPDVQPDRLIEEEPSKGEEVLSEEEDIHAADNDDALLEGHSPEFQRLTKRPQKHRE